MREPQREIKVGNITLVITERQIEQGLARRGEEEEAVRSLPSLVQRTDPSCPIQNPRQHKKKRLRHSEPWRGSGAEPIPGMTVTSSLGVKVNTQYSCLSEYVAHQDKVLARHAEHARVLRQYR